VLAKTAWFSELETSTPGCPVIMIVFPGYTTITSGSEMSPLLVVMISGPDIAAPVFKGPDIVAAV
jgi:hypothetical protein